MQDGACKYVQHEFGILQAKWEIVKDPCRDWKLETKQYQDVLQCII